MNITIPLIRKVLPKLVAQDLIGVQLMQDSAGEIFTFKTVTYVGDNPPPPCEGDTRHVFGRGWEIVYGGEWIPHDTWTKIKIAGL